MLFSMNLLILHLLCFLKFLLIIVWVAVRVEGRSYDLNFWSFLLTLYC